MYWFCYVLKNIYIFWTGRDMMQRSVACKHTMWFFSLFIFFYDPLNCKNEIKHHFSEIRYWGMEKWRSWGQMYTGACHNALYAWPQLDGFSNNNYFPNIKMSLLLSRGSKKNDALVTCLSLKINRKTKRLSMQSLKCIKCHGKLIQKMFVLKKENWKTKSIKSLKGWLCCDTT